MCREQGLAFCGRKRDLGGSGRQGVAFNKKGLLSK